MSVENLVDKAIKRIGKVHPVIKQGAEEIIRRAYKDGLYVLFSDGYRSHAEQNKLYEQGRTKSGKIVTNARGGQSYHNYGLALDMFITNKEGTTASWNVSDLSKAAKIAKSLGFEWGGDWKTFKDYPHIQMTGGLSIADLQRGKRPKLELKANKSSTTKKTTSKPKTSKKSNNKKYPLPSGILKRGSKGNGVKQLQRALNAAYFKCGAVDGIYGAKTEDAVRRFQMVHDAYNVDGIYGSRTKARLDKVVNK